MSNELGNFLRLRRGTMSLREFAEKCHISHTHLDSIEKGADPRTGKRVSISTDTLRLIADGLDVDFVFLACLADGWNPANVTNAVLPSGYQPKHPLEKTPIVLLKPNLQLLGGAYKKNPPLYSPQPVNILCCQYDIDAFLLSKICKIDGDPELWANGYHRLPEGTDFKMYPSGEMADALSVFFEVPVEDLKQGVLPLLPKASVQFRVSELKKTEGYPRNQAIKTAPTLSDEAVKVASAYENASANAQFGVKKLLDLDAQETELGCAARKSDEPHPTMGPDTDAKI